MWTREYIESLDEKILCLEVLVPLFTAMGYRDVDFVGGGSLEQGKDIVMWKPDPPRDRVDYAVVVKAEKITGQTKSGTVSTQVKQCFGRPYEDPSTHEKRDINYCFVVTSHAISTEGTHTLGSLLSQEHLTTRVHTIDGNKLWRLVEEYLPARLAAEALRKAYTILDPKDPAVSFEVRVNEGGTFFLVEPKSGAAFSISAPPEFPSTEKGQAERALFDEFLRTGRSVELGGEFLTGLELPEAVRKLLDALGTPDRVRLGRAAAEPLEFEVEVQSPNGSTFRIPHISFLTVEGGSDSVTLRNDGQALPFKLSVTINRNLHATLTYQFQFQGESVGWLMRHLEFVAAAVPGAVMRFRSHRSFEVFESHLTQERTGGTEFGPAYEDVVRKAVEIQEKTKSLVRVPDRPYFTAADVESIEWVTGLLRSGRGSHKGEITSTFDVASGNPDVARKLVEGGFEMHLEISPWREKVLDDTVNLGPAIIDARDMRIHPDDLQRVKAELESGARQFSCRLLPNDSGSITVTVLDWLPPDAGKPNQ